MVRNEMYIRAAKTPTSKHQNRADDKFTHQFIDNRRSTILQRQLAAMVDSSQKTIQQQPVNTGIPDNLKSGMESVAGMSLDHVKVHYNSSKPAAVQALAFAQGADIHLASGQEKHLPHELGHVVQQAQGRVQPTISVGGMQVNDNPGLEHEATSMGERALQTIQKMTNTHVSDPASGFSSAAVVPPRRHEPVMQAMFRLDMEQGGNTVVKGEGTRFHRMDKGEHNFLHAPENKTIPKLEAPSDLPPLNIADDGHIAVEAKSDVPKVMFMEAADIITTNEELVTVGSNYRLTNKGHTLSVPALDDTRHNLVSVMPSNISNDTGDLAMTGPQQCIEMAETVISQSKGDAYRQYLLDVATDNLPTVNRESIGKTLAGMVGEYAMAIRRGAQKDEREQLAKQASIEANQVPTVPREMVNVIIIEIEMINDLPETAVTLSTRLKQYNAERGETVLENSRAEGNKMNVTIYDPELHGKSAYKALLATQRFNALVKRSKWMNSQAISRVYRGPVVESDETWKPKLTTAVAAKENSLIETLEQLTAEELEGALRALGLNEHVKLKIGQAFGVTAATKSDSPKMDFPYHWAGVIAKRGDDVVTMENYARSEGATVEDDARWYLQMYGPLKKVNVSAEGAVTEDATVAEDYWKKGTFHESWKADFSPEGAVPFTVGVGTKPSEQW